MPKNLYNIMPVDYLVEIGLVVVSWGALLVTLDRCICRLLQFRSDDDRGHILLAHASFPEKIQILRSLIAAQKLPVNSALWSFTTDVLPLLEKAQKERNNALHHQWVVDEKGKVGRFNITSRKFLQVDLVPISREELHQSVLVIGHAASVLYQAVDTGLDGGSIEEFEEGILAPQQGQ